MDELLFLRIIQGVQKEHKPESIMFSEIVPVRHGKELRESILRNTSQ